MTNGRGLETFDHGFVPSAEQGADRAGSSSDGPSGQGGGGWQPSSPLVGREEQLRLLLEAVVSPPAVVSVKGEAGVGKSTLVRAALSSSVVGDRTLLVGHCHRLREPFPLGPVVEAVRGVGERLPARALSPLVGALQPLLPELTDVLPPEPSGLGDPRAERHRTFRALRELLASLGPTVCLLEDLHWADEGTLEFLGFLGSQPPEGLSLIVTYRTEDLPSSSPLAAVTSSLPSDTRRAAIELRPLSIDEVGSLSCALLGTSAVSEELAKHLHEQTAGIPFALEELVRLHRDQLDLVDGWGTADDLHEIGVPPAVQRLIRERMASFPGDAWLVARAAAVLAVPAGEELIGRVAGLPPVRTIRALTRVLAGAVLEERATGIYGFRHALAAQAVYDDTPGPERRRLHRRAAEALESAPEPRPLAQLAHHFKEAGRSRQWARYAEAAADSASSVGDDRAAARILEQALSAERLSRAAKVRMAVKLGPAALYSVKPETAIGPLQRILDEEPMPVAVRGELRYWISRLRCQTGDTGSWRDEMVRAAGELRRRPELAALAMVNLAWPAYGEDDHRQDLGWLDRAVQAVAQTDDSAAKTSVHTQRAAILLTVGDQAGWGALDAIPPEGSTVEEKLQLLRGYHSLSVAALGLGHNVRAESFLNEVARLDDELDHVSWRPWRECTQVSLDWRIGRWDGLESRIRELSERTAGRAGMSVANEIVLSWLLLSQSRVDDAERSFASILERARARSWMSARVTAAAGLARIRLARGDLHAAGEVAAFGLEIISRKGIWVWGRDLVPVAVQAFLLEARTTEAGDLVKTFSAELEGRDAPAALGARSFCQGLVAEAGRRHPAAARLFSDADRIWRELPCPYEAAQAREAQARCLLAQDDATGSPLLLGVLEVFEGLGAKWDATRVRAALRAWDIPVPSRTGGRRAYGDELSPREVEVAQLAATGRKNREIAETLFISQRTVETHVASALRKLGAESREALESALAALQD